MTRRALLRHGLTLPLCVFLCAFAGACGGASSDGATSENGGSSGGGDGPAGGGAADAASTNTQGGGPGAVVDGGADAAAAARQTLPATFTKRLLDTTQTENADARCNDGSAAGYYPAAGAPGATSWVIFLEGGSWCGSDAECTAREKSLTSSSAWPQTMAPAGILSSSAVANPHFAASNRVFVPYCTSDLFSGDTGPTAGTTKFQFRGRAVLDAVIRDLRSTYGLGAAGQSVLFAGASAGGIAVLATADRVAAALPGVKVAAVTDAGFLPDVAPLVGPSILAQLTTAVAFWNGQPDDSCAAAYPGAKDKCYLAQYAQPQITTPIFFSQNLEDPHGPLHAGGFTWPTAPTAAQIAWMNDVYTPAMVKQLSALPPAVGIFSPCKVVHTMIDNTAFTDAVVGTQHDSDAISAWFTSGTSSRSIATPCSYP
jgi:hypothetical protein